MLEQSLCVSRNIEHHGTDYELHGNDPRLAATDGGKEGRVDDGRP